MSNINRQHKMQKTNLNNMLYNMYQNYYIDHEKIFYGSQIFSMIQEIITIPKILTNNYLNKKNKEYNQNIDFMIKYWFSLYLNKYKYKPINLSENEIVWGIIINKKKYYFVCKKNKNCLSCKSCQICNPGNDKIKGGKFDENRSHPKYSLMCIRTDTTLDGYGITCLDLDIEICGEIFDKNNFKFEIHESFKQRCSQTFGKHLINWLTKFMKNNPEYYNNYNHICTINGISKICTKSQLMFPFHDKNKRYEHKLTQFVTTIAETKFNHINNEKITVYKIIGIENKSPNVFLKFGAQYVCMMKPNEINKKFNWFFKQNNLPAMHDNEYITNQKTSEINELKAEIEYWKKQHAAQMDYAQRNFFENSCLKQALNMMQCANIKQMIENTKPINLSTPKPTLTTTSTTATATGTTSNALLNNDLTNLITAAVNINNNINPNIGLGLGIGLNGLININNKQKLKNENKIDYFEQEIIEATNTIKIFGKIIKNTQKTNLIINGKDDDCKNMTIYGVFTSIKDEVSVPNKIHIYVGKEMNKALDGLLNEGSIKKNHRIYIIKCQTNMSDNDLTQKLAMGQGITTILGKNISQISEQRVISIE